MNKGMKKTGVEAVSCANDIHHLRGVSGRIVTSSLMHGQGAFCTAFHNKHRNRFGKFPDRIFKGRFVRQSACLSFVGASRYRDVQGSPQWGPPTDLLDRRSYPATS